MQTKVEQSVRPNLVIEDASERIQISPCFRQLTLGPHEYGGSCRSIMNVELANRPLTFLARELTAT